MSDGVAGTGVMASHKMLLVIVARKTSYKRGTYSFLRTIPELWGKFRQEFVSWGSRCRRRAWVPVDDIETETGAMMAEKEKKNLMEQFSRTVQASSDYLGLGMQVAGGFAFFVFLGYRADERFGTSPWLLLAGVVAGMVGIGLVLAKVVRNLDKKE